MSDYINEILEFAGNAATDDIFDLEAYLGASARLTGHVPGLADQRLENAVLRQVSRFSGGVAQFIAQHYEPGVVDDGDKAKIVAGLEAAINALIAAQAVEVGPASETEAGIVELATSEETIAGDDDARATHPAGVHAAISAALAELDLRDDRARDLAIFNAFVSHLSAARVSGPIPGGCIWIGEDYAATKTNLTYDGSLKVFANAAEGVVSGTNAGIAAPGNITLIDRSWSIPNSVIVYKMGFYAEAAGKSVVLKIVRRDSAGNYTVMVSQAVTSVAAGWNDFTLATPYNVPASGTFHGAAYQSGGTVGCVGSGTAIAYANFEGSGSFAATENTVANGPCCRVTYGGSATNGTLIPVPYTAEAAPAHADVYLLYRAVDAVVQGSDHKVRATRDGGTSWSGFGTITKLCDFDASGYQALKVTIDMTGLASGTSFTAEITSLNNKSQRWRGIAALFR